MKRLVAVVAAAGLLSGGCTYAKEEPGLFSNKATSSPTVENAAAAGTHQPGTAGGC